MRALLVVFTEPSGPECERAYNDWYTNEHLPDVLAVPGYRRATRYRAVDGPRAVAQAYLALYELEVADRAALQAVSNEHMRRIAEGAMRRSPPGVMHRDAMRARYYEEAGVRLGDDGPDGDGPVPDAVALAFVDPGDPEHELAGVLAEPGVRSASLWRLTDIDMLDRPWVVPYQHLVVAHLDRGGHPWSPRPGAVSHVYTRISDRITAPAR